MQIRPMRGSDWLQVEALIREAHGRSDRAHNPIDYKYVKELCLLSCMTNFKTPELDATKIFVAEIEGAVVGVTIIAAHRLYEMGTQLEVSDLITYVRPRTHARVFAKLWDAVEAWSTSSAKVVAIRPGITGAIGDPERTAKFFLRRGYKREGLMMGIRLEAAALQRRSA